MKPPCTILAVIYITTYHRSMALTTQIYLLYIAVFMIVILMTIIFNYFVDLINLL